MSGFYYVTALPRTNLFLMVIENWKQYKNSFFYNFNCKIAQSIVNSGAYRIINGTCAHTSASTSNLAEEGKCPQLRDINVPCTYTTACFNRASHLLLLLLTVVQCWLISY
ncbi:hypothetical protein LSAT2_005466 [Lamellibrachia satsuma]|nr:hypothetical protein LSAT2_005466 [Lamellibrachia satsuma]